VTKRNLKAVHRGFVRGNEELWSSSVKHNTGTVSLGIQEINAPLPIISAMSGARKNT